MGKSLINKLHNNICSGFYSQVLHSLVCNIKKQSVTALGHPLLIQCKNFQLIQLIIAQESDCNDVFMSLFRLSRAGKLKFSPNLRYDHVVGFWTLMPLLQHSSKFTEANGIKWIFRYQKPFLSVCSNLIEIILKMQHLKSRRVSQFDLNQK